MDSLKPYIRPAVAAFIYYCLQKYTPVFGVIAGLFQGIMGTNSFSNILTWFVVFFVTFLPVPFIAKNKKHTLVIAVAVTLFCLYGLIFAVLGGYATASAWLLILASFAGAFSARSFADQLFGGESDQSLKAALKTGESPIISKRVSVISVEHRDESSVSVDAHTTNRLITIGNTTTTFPHTVYRVKRNKRDVQEIWYKDKEGAESKLRLMNRDIDVRAGHELDLIYTTNGNLEYIKNLNTSSTTPLYNYVFDYHVINTGQDIWGNFCAALLFAIPLIGALYALLSITTSYSYLNKPVRRSYLGMVTLWSSLFAAITSSLLTWSLFTAFMNGNFSFDLLLRGYIITAVLIVVARYFAMFLTSKRAKRLETQLLKFV